MAASSLEDVSWVIKLKLRLLALTLPLLTVACASKILQYENTEQLQTNKEYEEHIQIKSLPPAESGVSTAPVTGAPTDGVVPAPPAGRPQAELKSKPDSKAKPKSPTRTKKVEKASSRRQPELEDTEGFVGRRPLVDPFRVGEKVTLALSYFNVTAGTMDLEVLPFVEVNQAKSYQFKVTIRSNTLFSRFYTVDDSAVTFVNYETLLPYNFVISVRESNQLADIRSFFDFDKLKGHYWEKRVSKSKGERQKNLEWDIKPFSQNVVSAIFYLRNFTLAPGKSLAIPVADEGKNIVFTGEVLRREEIDTAVGRLKTVVVKPKVEVDGVFKPVGDILLWMTDDARKFVVRLESKIKIGTIVGKVQSIVP